MRSGAVVGRGMAVGLVAMLTVVTPAAIAHPHHVTIGEAEFNAETGRLEVSLEVSPLDLDEALERATGEEVDLDGDRDAVSAAIVAYLEPRFQVRRKGEVQRSRVRWVGMELDVQTAVLYFTLDLPGGLEGAEFGHRIFFELDEAQVNTLHFRLPGDRRETIHFLRARPWRGLGEDEEDPEGEGGDGSGD